MLSSVGNEKRELREIHSFRAFVVDGAIRGKRPVDEFASEMASGEDRLNDLRTPVAPLCTVLLKRFSRVCVALTEIQTKV